MTRFKKIKIFSILMAISMSLSGCGRNDIKEVINNKDNIVMNEDDFIESSTIMPEPAISPVDELTEEYLSYFNSLQFKYNHEEFYPNKETLNNIYTVNKQLNECSYEFDGDVESLVDTIKNNTELFVESHPEYKNPFIELSYGSALTKAIVSIKNNSKNNLNEDFHQISNMAIVIGSEKHFSQKKLDDYIAYYKDGLNIIVINKTLIDNLVEKYKYPYSDYIYYILSHEINHTRENVCPCNENHQYNNIDYNDEGYSFLLEACAESDLYNTREFSDMLASFSYKDERKAEGELFLLGILNESLDKYYNSMFDIDYPSLFEFFDLKTEEEKIDFLKMIYCIDGKFYRNDLVNKLLSPISDDYSGLSMNDLKKITGLTYKENIFKNCMINLIEYTSRNEDFSLQENLIILNIIKSYLVNETYTYDETAADVTRIYDQEVLMNIDTMENVYIEYLSQKYQISIEEIRKYENTEIVYIIEAMKYILEDENVDFGLYSKNAKKIMEKFPVIRGVLMSNLDIPYNVYESRIKEITLKQN